MNKHLEKINTKTKICPVHQCHLKKSATKYGFRYDCTVPDCDVMCWGGRTSTPATARTRSLRILCHKLFDAIWKNKEMSRQEAYQWMRKRMKKTTESAHIGMFNHQECELLLTILNERKETK